MALGLFLMARSRESISSRLQTTSRFLESVISRRSVFPLMTTGENSTLMAPMVTETPPVGWYLETTMAGLNNITSGRASCRRKSSASGLAGMAQWLLHTANIDTIPWVADGTCRLITSLALSRIARVTPASPWASTGPL